MSLIKNKQANFNYHLIDKVEAGIKLSGNEVKSLKKGQGSLKEAFVIIKGGELFLIKAYIPPFQNQLTTHKDHYRPRKLLLKKTEVNKLSQEKQLSGLTLIPLKFYNKNGLIKLEIALAKGKKKADKREAIKTRDIERDLGRKLKNRR